MICNEEFERLAGGLTEAGLIEFIRSNLDHLVHFYMVYASDSVVTELLTFELGDLDIPTVSIGSRQLMLVFTRKEFAASGIEDEHRIGSVKLSEALSIASAKNSIDGVFLQGEAGGFAVPDKILELYCCRSMGLRLL